MAAKDVQIAQKDTLLQEKDTQLQEKDTQLAQVHEVSLIKEAGGQFSIHQVLVFLQY